MKISLNWLSDYVDVPMSVQELSKRLALVGLGTEDIAETATDVVLDLEVTSNRPDWLGHLGVAREVAAVTGAAFKPPRIGPLPTSGKAADLTSVEVLAPDLCPRYTARVIRGVKVGASPSWLVERLEAVGMRSVNNVVDVTNFVLMEYSQPLHSFDFDKLAGRRIVVRRAKAGEQIVSIDGTRCTLDESMLVIADAERPVAVAGVMGGLNTEVGLETRNLLIESAQFDPLNIRRTSRKLALMSDSNYRFERGVDPVGIDEASMRACQLIIELAGGELAEGLVDAWAAPYVPPVVALRPARCDALLGITIPADRQAELLKRLGLSPKMEDGKIVCTIPPFRRDLTREIDLIEEVARLEGYDKIPVAHKVTHVVTPETPQQRLRRLTGEALAAAGFDETITFSFIDPAEAELFGHQRTIRVDPLVRKTNNVLRPTLLPSLLRACKTNQDAGTAEVSLWELGSVFPPGPQEPQEKSLPQEHPEVALVSTGDLRQLRGAMEHWVRRLAPEATTDLREATVAGFAPGRAAEIFLDGEPFGAIGMIDAAVLNHYGLDKPLAAAALRYDAASDRANLTRHYAPIPRFPAVQRDLSFIVAEDVAWRQIAGTIREVAQALRAAVDYVTTYRGKPIADGRKSVTVTLTYRSAEGTLRSEVVDEQVAQVVAAVKAKLAAELRA
jgi:phenylalanyl-tRNA synthetase beta chain